jgi:hypothetical protein
VNLIKVLGILIIFMLAIPAMPIVASSPTAFIGSSSDGALYSISTVYSTANGATTGNVYLASSVDFPIGQFKMILNGTTMYDVNRGYLYFDTSGLDDSLTILAANLKIYGFADDSITDFDITIQAEAGGSTYPHDPMVSGDYDQANYSGSGGTLNTSSFSTSGYNIIPLNASGISWINKTGYTKFCLRSSRDIAGIIPTGHEAVSIYTEEHGNGYQPELDIIYSPSITAHAATNVSMTSAKLNAVVDDDGGDTTGLYIRFGYGKSSHIAADFESYTVKTSWALSAEGAVFANVTSLDANNVYYYRAQVKNATTTVVTSVAEITFDTTDQVAELQDYTLPSSSSGILTGTLLMPPQMYTELDTSKIPGGDAIDDILATAGLTGSAKGLFWFPFIFIGLGIFGLLLYGLTAKDGQEGSLLLLTIVIEAGLVLFGVVGAMNTSSLIPLWPMFLFPIPAIALIMSKKMYSW